MVRALISAVHLCASGPGRHPDFPQGVRARRGLAECKTQSVAKTCAQIAIMPRNNASEASAAASSNTERNIASSIEHRGNIVHITFRSSRGISNLNSERPVPTWLKMIRRCVLSQGEQQ